MIIIDGLITGTICTHGYGALACYAEHVDVAFSLSHMDVSFSLGAPYALTQEGEEVFVDITMKYPED